MRVRFHPQAWINDYAVAVDSNGKGEWEVGELDLVPDDDTYESDQLRFHHNAPQWVQEWDGPFYIEVLGRDE